MATDYKSESQSKSEESLDSPSKKQDPLERRRLQNRLSQRNHRRKIRDRIAKLQERVIANELRASAALNGWDKPYSPSPLMSTRQSNYTSYPEPELSFASPDQSPQNTEPSTPFLPLYTFSNPTVCSSDTGISQSSALSGDSGYFLGSTTCSPSTLSSPASSSHGVPLMVGNPDIDPFQDPWALGGGEMGNSLSPNTGISGSGSGNQPCFYVVTENALPDIIQALKTTSSTSKIIVVVPTPTVPSIASSMAAGNLQSPCPSDLNILSCSNIENTNQPLISTCKCQTQSTYQFPKIPNSHLISRAWQNTGCGPGTSPGSYVVNFPAQKQPLSPNDNFTNMHV